MRSVYSSLKNNFFSSAHSGCLAPSSRALKSAQETSSPASGSRRPPSDADEYGVIAMFDVTQGATTLRQIFEDTELLERFILYTTKKHAPENVLFLKNYLNIEKVEEADLEKHYDELVFNFLDENAIHQVNLPSDLASQLKSKPQGYEDLLKLITRAADIAFVDLKSSEIFRSFIQTDQKVLSKSLNINLINDYLKYADHKTINSLLTNPSYGLLIRFISMVQKFEVEKPDLAKKQLGSKIFVTFVAQGSPFEIPRELITKFYIKLLERDDYSSLSDIRIETIHYLLKFEDIVNEARAWRAAPTKKVQSGYYRSSLKW